MRSHRLFELDAAARWRLSYDSQQWILEKRNGDSGKPGKESGYRGVSFVGMKKETLLRVCREKKVELSDVATALLEAMPKKFSVFRDEIRALGRDKWLARLVAQAGIVDRPTERLFGAAGSFVNREPMSAPAPDNDEAETEVALVTIVELVGLSVSPATQRAAA